MIGTALIPRDVHFRASLSPLSCSKTKILLLLMGITEQKETHSVSVAHTLSHTHTHPRQSVLDVPRFAACPSLPSHNDIPCPALPLPCHRVCRFSGLTRTARAASPGLRASRGYTCSLRGDDGKNRPVINNILLTTF